MPAPLVIRIILLYSGFYILCDHRRYLVLIGRLSPVLPHNAFALFASACCSDDLAIVCTIPHEGPSVNIYVGNLEFSTTDHDLRQLFEPYGVVDVVRVITDRDTGRSKGFGFV